MNQHTPIPRTIVEAAIQKTGLANVGGASIREIRRLIDLIEADSGVSFLRMEMGIPGLAPPAIGVEAERAALAAGVAQHYPPVAGVPELKHEVSRFVQNVIGVSVSEEGCLPTVGTLQGSMAAFLVAGHMHPGRRAVLFLDPGFPVHALQARMLGLEVRRLDIADSRGPKLAEALEAQLADGSVCALLYSNPNNPTWMCLNDEELAVIAAAADRHDLLVLEDFAYIAMDTRTPYRLDGNAPFQPSVLHHSDRALLLISSSKAFSYAGQRVGMLVVPDAQYARRYPELAGWFGHERFGAALTLGALYGFSAGVSHSAQYGLAAILKAVNEGEYRFLDTADEYSGRAAEAKRIFVRHGFSLVYDTDVDQPLGDGFYFTIAYPGFTGEALVAELFYYGISAIALSSTGARREGLRACVSFLPTEVMPELDRRLAAFRADHPVPKSN
ncbi:MAG: pyridoxal phosphate-dependent aminotransferase [Spirochaetaceae bacterium]|nr:MAG: pyridoxal phosphate-dependent aminotransferase [Spirochaetaceae bacterium]